MAPNAQLFKGMNDKDLRSLARTLEALNRTTIDQAPKTDDELYEWIKKNVGVDIPRESVCEGHVAPFDFLSDMFFERETSAIAMANRGGAKTFMAALWHFLNSKFKPKCEGASVGAIEQQALRAYENLRKIIIAEGKVDLAEQHPEIATSIMRETRWKNGSRVEVLAGTMAAVNGPHPQKVHFDEVELAEPQVFQESRNMSQSRHGIKAQDIITSTRKRAYGPMQVLVDEVKEAERQGMDPPYKLYTWCVFECAEQQKGCQVAYPDLPEDKRCPCHQVAKGSWEEGKPRTFKDVCGGRMARSRGWIPLTDIHKIFRTTSQDVWEAQQECSKPSTSGLVLPMFTRERHCMRWWDPDPELGPIYMGVDYGGSNPHAVLWFQSILYDVDVLGYHQQRGEEPKKRLKEGTKVFFDEIYVAEIGNMALAQLVIDKETSWRRKHPGFRVQKRFVDVQAKAARLDWANHDPPLPTQSYVSKDVLGQVKLVKELVQDDLLIVDAARCNMLIEEYEAWHYKTKRGYHIDKPEDPVSDFDHAVSASRYGLANVRLIEYQSKKQTGELPSASPEGYTERRVTGSGPVRYLPRAERPYG